MYKGRCPRRRRQSETGYTSTDASGGQNLKEQFSAFLPQLDKDGYNTYLCTVHKKLKQAAS